MDQFELRFTGKELDYIANVLAQRPWAEVQALLANIKQQVDMAQQGMPIPRSNGHDTQELHS